MEYKIERVHHSNPTLKIIHEQGQRIPLEKLKENIDAHLGGTSRQGLEQDRGKPVSKDLMDKILEDANSMMLGHKTHFEFKIHEKTGEVIVKLVDNETKEVVKEIPSEKLVEIMSNLCELVGLCLDQKA